MTSATPMPSRPSSRNLLAATLTIRVCVSALSLFEYPICSHHFFPSPHGSLQAGGTIEYHRTLHLIGCKPWVQGRFIASINIDVASVANEATTKCRQKDFIKYFATYGLRSYSTVVNADRPVTAQEKQ